MGVEIIGRFLGEPVTMSLPVPCWLRQPQEEGLSPRAGRGASNLPGTPVAWLPLAFHSTYPSAISQEDLSQPHPTHLSGWVAPPSKWELMFSLIVTGL